MSKVSIVSSVYNKAPYLVRCLDSLINQTFHDIEIILVDNGSTDGSADIIEKYKAQDSRIRLIRLRKNIGSAGGISTGINHVTTEFFTICDADDYIDPDYVDILYREMLLENADVVMCTNDYVSGDGTYRVNKRPDVGKLVFEGEEMEALLPQLLDPYSDEYFGYPLPEIGAAWAKLYRTKVVKSNNINYEIGTYIWSDWLFNFKVLKETRKLVYTEQTVYHNFMSENSVIRSRNFNRNRSDEMERILRRFEEECRDVADVKGSLYKARNRFNARVILSLIGYYRKYYKVNLNLKDEIKYINKISCIAATQKIDPGKCGNAISKIKRIRLFLLKHRFCIAEIIYIPIYSLMKKGYE